MINYSIFNMLISIVLLFSTNVSADTNNQGIYINGQEKETAFYMVNGDKIFDAKTIALSILSDIIIQ